MSMFQQKQSTEEGSKAEATKQEADSQEREKDASYEEAAQAAQAEKNTMFSTSRFVTGVLRMIGFDATKLGALAINALILLAQTVSRIHTYTYIHSCICE